VCRDIILDGGVLEELSASQCFERFTYGQMAALIMYVAARIALRLCPLFIIDYIGLVSDRKVAPFGARQADEDVISDVKHFKKSSRKTRSHEHGLTIAQMRLS